MNNNYKTQKSFTVFNKVHSDFIKLCQENGITASQAISNFEYMYLTNKNILQSQISDVEISKGAKSYGR